MGYWLCYFFLIVLFYLKPTQLIFIVIAVAEKCDLFTGDWIPDSSGPAYTNESCHEIENHQNCMRNGRPDSDYLYWRWNPRDCGLPRFNPERFLDLMRNKSWAFIGDSISRNHVQSLLCILSQVHFCYKFLVFKTLENFPLTACTSFFAFVFAANVFISWLFGKYKRTYKKLSICIFRKLHSLHAFIF